jgi:catechol 2,3-dioxygenase-like lactoylglutathione lyase family enzyme
MSAVLSRPVRMRWLAFISSPARMVRVKVRPNTLLTTCLAVPMEAAEAPGVPAARAKPMPSANPMAAAGREFNAKNFKGVCMIRTISQNGEPTVTPNSPGSPLTQPSVLAGYRAANIFNRARDIKVRRLDHVSIGTDKLRQARDFYVELLGLAGGPRPKLKSTGYWLYAGDDAVIHLVEKGTNRDAPAGTDAGTDRRALKSGGEAEADNVLETGSDDPIALSVEESSGAVKYMKDNGIAYWDRLLADRGLYQIFCPRFQRRRRRVERLRSRPGRHRSDECAGAGLSITAILRDGPTVLITLLYPRLLRPMMFVKRRKI